MGKGWDVFFAILLLFMGSTCLFISTIYPFTLNNSWIQGIHVIEIIVLIFISCLFFGYYWNSRKTRNRNQLPCSSCQYPLQQDWEYCPKCGDSISGLFKHTLSSQISSMIKSDPKKNTHHTTDE